MFFRNLLFVVGFFLLAIVNSHATTIAEECQKRSMSAYDKGSSDAGKQKLGAAAASECFNEMEDALNKNGRNGSSSTGSSVIGTILLLGVGGFLVYKLATKGDKPMTPNEIGSLREKVRCLYKPDSSDAVSVQKLKESRLSDAEKMFSAALAGVFPIRANSMKGSLSESSQELEDAKATARNFEIEREADRVKIKKVKLEMIAANQKALDSAIEARSSISAIFALPPGDEEEMATREEMKGVFARIEESIKEHQKNIDELQLSIELRPFSG